MVAFIRVTPSYRRNTPVLIVVVEKIVYFWENNEERKRTLLKLTTGEVIAIEESTDEVQKRMEYATSDK